MYAFLYESSDLTLESVNLVRDLSFLFTLLAHLEVYADVHRPKLQTLDFSPLGTSWLLVSPRSHPAGQGGRDGQTTRGWGRREYNEWIDQWSLARAFD